MSGAFSRVNGSTGQAPTSVWMSPLADRLTMTCPIQPSSPYDKFFGGIPAACLFANQHLLFNATLGAFTTAPDGTTNIAQKIVEDSTASAFHGVFGSTTHGDTNFVTRRLSGIFKAGERTRVCLSLGDNNTGFATNYVHVGFDLSGGQVAYSNTVAPSGSATSLGQGMSPLGGGWFLCWMDASINNGNFAGVVVNIFLDSGSGLAAESTTYTGNGTSGLFGWKTSMLPRDAWKINTRTLFDDFNDPTMANIDQTNTKAPGFTWYVDSTWGNYQGGPNVIPNGQLSATSSILHIPAQTKAHGGFNPSLVSAASTGPGTYVGRGWVPPVFFEANYRFPYAANTSGGQLVWWSIFLEFQVAFATNLNLLNIVGGEFDFNEWFGVNETYPLIGAHWYYTVPGTGFVDDSSTQNFRAAIGCAPWSNFIGYTGPAPVAVASGGNFYYNNTNTTGNMPPSAQWTSFVYGTTTGLQNLEMYTPNVFDFNNFHTYGALICPYNRSTKDQGGHYFFIDNVFLGTQRTWGLHDFGYSDWQQLMFLFTPGNDLGAGEDMFIDWVRVTQ